MSEPVADSLESFVNDQTRRIKTVLEFLRSPDVMCQWAQEHEHAETIRYLEGYAQALGVVGGRMDMENEMAND